MCLTANVLERDAFVEVVAIATVGAQLESLGASAEVTADSVFTGMFTAVIISGAFVVVHASVRYHIVARLEGK